MFYEYTMLTVQKYIRRIIHLVFQYWNRNKWRTCRMRRSRASRRGRFKSGDDCLLFISFFISVNNHFIFPNFKSYNAIFSLRSYFKILARAYIIHYNVYFSWVQGTYCIVITLFYYYLLTFFVVGTNEFV